MLRGLAALVRWAELGAGSFPLDAVRRVIEHLVATFPDGVVRPQRRAYAGKGTLAQRDGAWVREPASTFPLLEAASVLGEPSEALTRQWSATRRALIGLIDDGRLAAWSQRPDITCSSGKRSWRRSLRATSISPSVAGAGPR